MYGRAIPSGCAFNRILLTIAALLAIACPAKAQTTPIPTTGSLTVTAQLVPGCGIVGGGSGTGLDFGTIDYGSFPAITQGVFNAATAGGSLQIECSPDLVVMVSIDAGGHSANGGAQRNLAGPDGALIPYRLYFDEARTEPLDVGMVVSTTVSGTVNLPIYGEVTLSGGTTPPGTYTDVAHVTLAY